MKDDKKIWQLDHYMKCPQQATLMFYENQDICTFITKCTFNLYSSKVITKKVCYTIINTTRLFFMQQYDFFYSA